MKDIIIIGGDTAIEDALHLSRLAEKVYVIVRKDGVINIFVDNYSI